jgi:hypothetical protein
VVHVGLGIKQDPDSKMINTKGLAMWLKLVEHLPSKCKALSSTPSIMSKMYFSCIIYIFVK